MACDRDHRSVVGAKLRPRKEHPTAFGRDRAREFLAQAPIGANSARNHECVDSGLAERPERLGDERFDHCALETPRDVGARLPIEILAANRYDHRGLQAAEAEIEAGPVEHRARKYPEAVPPAPRELRKCGPTRIVEPQQLCGLVECLARSIVQRLAEHAVAPDSRNQDEHRVAARDLEGDKGKSRSLGL